MAVRVRLRRIGKNPKGKPHFRVSVFDETRGRDSRIIEELGFYNPLTGEARLNREKIDQWVKSGAQVSATIKSLLKKKEKGA
jgi:small subunit ribosomal protein S16